MTRRTVAASAILGARPIVDRDRLLAIAATALLAGVGLVGWLIFVTQAARAGDPSWSQREPAAWQLDWRVYAAGAQDLVDRTVYVEPLDLHGLLLPVDRFNLPPLAAAAAVPLLPLPLETAGTVWLVISAGSLAFAAVIAAHLARLPFAWAWAGAALALYSLNVNFWLGLVVGTNNALVLALIAGFAWLHVDQRERSAGVALGLAIGMKLWPAALVVPLVRDRRWRQLRWCAATLAVQAAAVLAWLGPEVVPSMVASLRLHVPPTAPVIGPSQLREAFAWWPASGGAVLAAAFLAAPAHGRRAIGLAILAGLWLIPNLWSHYLPFAAFAVALVTAPALAVRGMRLPRHAG